MGDYLMDLLKPRIDERVNREKQDYARQTTLNNLYEYVQKGGMSVDFAAQETKQEPSAFIASMRKAGYRVPEARA